jgi:outer membrane protein
MKRLSLYLSIVAIALSGTLLFLHLQEKKPMARVVEEPRKANPPFRIAYFLLDSLQNNYQYFKDALAVLKGKEETMNNELSGMEKTYQRKVAEWKQKGNTMSQAEAEAANLEYQQMQQNLTTRKQQVDQSMNDLMNDSKKKIRDRIEEFLKEYNKDKNYAYIFSDFPEAIFYKDTIYNITNDVIRGLNESYKKK